MHIDIGRIREIRLDARGAVAAGIACPRRMIPAPGQFTLAFALEQPETPLATPLFLGESRRDGFWAVPPLPAEWGPGTHLELRGPLGCGFHLPAQVSRLALVALGDRVERLLPLLGVMGQGERAVTLFTDAPLPALPAALEAAPLLALPEALAWPDFIAVDVPAERLGELRKALGLGSQAFLPCPGQALVTLPMPCGGLAECGACAVPVRRSWKMACSEGPVFDLKELI
jgi:hypothetical protein